MVFLYFMIHMVTSYNETKFSTPIKSDWLYIYIYYMQVTEYKHSVSLLRYVNVTVPTMPCTWSVVTFYVVYMWPGLQKGIL